ncbi:hypothetical protein AVEN_69847-1 [Araneus ventricosus]|uniref:Uncharacterized protein n=1 Tax=Araneus ventricosus TaxID=182803 RepID=A0A4Y2KCC1_ARAVE|nr:hypothetical protein AVEN_69847-1 [Araneus ventricosus]
MFLSMAFILGFRNTPIEARLSCTFAASTCCRALRRCSSSDLEKFRDCRFFLASCLEDFNRQMLNTRTKIFRDGGTGPTLPPLATPLIPRPKTIPTANIVGKFGFVPIVTHDWPKNHGLNCLVMEDVLSLKLQPMDAKIGTIYHWIWTAGPKSAEEPHKGWSGFMKNVARKKMIRKVCSDTLALRQSSTF